MTQILEFIKNYFIFMLILFLFSYLVPKENYRKYFNFFIGVLMAAVLIQPFLVFVSSDSKKEMESTLREIEEKLSDLEYQGKGENIFEQFLGEATETE